MSTKNTSPPTQARIGIVLLATFFKEQMEQTETVMIQGRRKKVCLLEITARRFLQRAIQGDERAMKDLLALVKKAEKWRKLRPKLPVLVIFPCDVEL